MAFDVPSPTEPEKRPPWRPTAYRAEMCDRVVEWGRQGKSRAWIAAELGVCKRTVQVWEEKHPDFVAAMTRAKTLEQQWWEDAGQTGMVGDKFNGSVWSRSMGARFPDDWREKTAVVGGDKDDNPIKQEHTHRNLDEVVSRIAGLAARLGATGDPEGTDGD